MESAQKVTAHHLQRSAYLYVRQSSVRQVFENTESTARQYALRQRAVALGWPQERIVVIDSDQGQSGASATQRAGFQHLVAEVGMGRAGLVMGLEVSRLARNSGDWHRLLEICGLTQTLILDEDGLYDPTHFNDRLLLGLKGTMSEAELHLLRARLRGGMLHKARRGELRIRLPVGLVYDAQGRVVLDADQQVVQSVRLLFEVFQRTGSAHATTKYFREQQLRFPHRIHGGACQGQLVWRDLGQTRVLGVLRNPRYAGAYAFGRRQQRYAAQGRMRTAYMPRDQWHTLLLGAHPGFIPWEEYEENQRRLHDNAVAHGGGPRRPGPPREGPALLQGLAVCGHCGTPMSVRYHSKPSGLRPTYGCPGNRSTRAERTCQHFTGSAIDRVVGELLIEVMSPVALEVPLAVQRELAERFEETDRLRRQHVDRCRYEAELARRRYLKVDPDNRLVADSLEADWNEKLRALAEAEEDYRRRREADASVLSQEQQERILALATDFPRLWNDPKTPDRERKRMARLLLEDVTLVKGDDVIRLHVCFKGGATRTLTLPRPKTAWQLVKTRSEVVTLIDRLLDDHTDGEIAAILNERGIVSGTAKPFHAQRVAKTRRAYGLQHRRDRLRQRGLLTLAELCRKLGVHPEVIRSRRRRGSLPFKAYKLDDVGRHMYEDPGAHLLPPRGTRCTKRT